ncbi:MAG: ABC transporter ATP-binding protein, partial [Rhodospirillales bacterium]
LARAVAPRPRVLLLDEPLSALDAALREQLRDELALLLRQLSITAVFVTHDQAEAMAIADRVAVMRGGEILQIDRPETLYRKPASGFVATFVGGANRLAGPVSNGALKLRGGELALPPGEGAVAYVRPENFRITDPGAPGALRGRVTGRIFVGMHYRLTVAGIADEPVTVVTADAAPPPIGAEIGLAAAAESILLLGENA